MVGGSNDDEQLEIEGAREGQVAGKRDVEWASRACGFEVGVLQGDPRAG